MPKPYRIWDQDDVIRECIKKYAECSLGDYSVTCWPDKKKNPANAPEIDAIAKAPGKPDIAIEHTRLESFAGQLMDDQQILDRCGRIEARVRPHVRHGVSCWIPILTFKKGFDWEKVQEALEQFLLREAGNLPVGKSVQQIPGVPFPCTFFYDQASDTDFRFGRFAPSSKQVEVELTASMEKALLHKKDRLNEFLSAGARTLLILESEDIALISPVGVYKAFLRAQRSVGSSHLTEVMFGRTYSKPQISWFAFLGDDGLLRCVNNPNWHIGPAFAAEWQPVL